MGRDDLSTKAEREMTRRRVLQAMGAGGAAGLFGGLLGSGCASDEGRPRTEGAPQSSEPSKEKRSLYLATGKIHADVKELHLVVPSGSYDLEPLETSALATVKRDHPIVGRLNEPGVLTHAVHDVAVHAELATPAYIYGKAPWGKVIVGSIFVVPIAQTRKWAKQYLEAEKLAGIFKKHSTLKALGLPESSIPVSVDEAVAASSLGEIPTDTGIALIFKNFSITNLVQSAETLALIASSGVNDSLVQTIATFIEYVGSYGEFVDCVNKDGVGNFYLTPDTYEAPGFDPVQLFAPYFYMPKTIKGQPIEEFPELAANMPIWTAQFRSQYVTASGATGSAIRDATSLGLTEEFDALNPPTDQDYAGTTWRQNVVTPLAPVSPTTVQTEQGAVSSVSLNPSRASAPSAPAGKIQNGPGEVTYSLSKINGYGAWAELSGTEDGQPKIQFFNNNLVTLDIYVSAWDNQQPNQQVGMGEPWNKGNKDWGSVKDTTIALGAIGPIPTIMGIPVAWMFGNNHVDVKLPFPPNAFSMSLLFAGLGWSKKDGSWTDWWPDGTYSAYNNESAPLGAGARLGTIIFNLALGTLAVSLGVWQEIGIHTGYISKEKLVECLLWFNTIPGMTRGIIMPILGLTGVSGQVYGGSETNVGNVVSMILQAGLGLVAWIVGPSQWAKMLAATAAQEVAKAVPIVGEVLSATLLAAAVANLSMSTAQIGGMPTLFGQTLTRTTTWQVTIRHDLLDASFPKAATKWRLLVNIRTSNGEAQQLPPIEDNNFQHGATVQKADLVIMVHDVPVGGQIQFVWTCRTVNNQVVGKTVAGFPNTPGGHCVNPGWMQNFPPEHPSPVPPAPSEECPVPPATFGYVYYMLKEIAVPIHPDSTMFAKGTTQDTGSSLSYEVIPNAGGSMATLACAAVGDVCASGAVSVGTVTGLVGFTYQATYRESDGTTQTGWFVQQIGSGPASDGVARIEKPYRAEPLLVYDKKGKALTNGNNFLLEPIMAGATTTSGHYVRKLDLKNNGLTFDPQAYWGQFHAPVNAVTLHPSGMPVAIHTASATLHILRQPPFASLVPEPEGCRSAEIYGGPGNANGLNPGLTMSPVDVVATSTGAVLVLEQAAGRIQAFDVAGNPCKYFPNSSYYAQLKAKQTSVTYLGVDIDIEDMLWVLHYTGTGNSPSDFGVDVYDKTGKYIVTMPGMNGHNFAVDLWRTVYTQNFTPITNAGGNVYLDRGAPVPSVTMWIPNTPEGPPE